MLAAIGLCLAIATQYVALNQTVESDTIAVDAAGNAYVAVAAEIDRIAPNGQVTKFADVFAFHLAMARDGALWFGGLRDVSVYRRAAITRLMIASPRRAHTFACAPSARATARRGLRRS
jgi:hypothetical protein